MYYVFMNKRYNQILYVLRFLIQLDIMDIRNNQIYCLWIFIFLKIMYYMVYRIEYGIDY